MMISNNDILYKVLLFSNTQDLPKIAAVSKQWKAAVEQAQPEIFGANFCQRFPRLADMIQLVPTTDFDWKQAFRIQVAPTWNPKGLNQALQKDLETVFRPRGIVAFTNCCRYGCSSAYNEEDSTFRDRQDDGIYFIRFTLNGGMNYSPDKYVHDADWFQTMSNHPEFFGIPVSYGSLEYLYQYWETESAMLGQFCAVLGLNEGDYTLYKPDTIDRCVKIGLKKSVHLETWNFDDEESDEEMSDEEMSDEGDY